MARPDLRIICCLCGKPIPRKQSAFALDEEWKRRYPSMVGVLACHRCASDRTTWWCWSGDAYITGHQPSKTVETCLDSWDHIEREGTHTAMVWLYPAAGVQQGAEDYLRHVVSRPTFDPELAHGIRDALRQHDPAYTATAARATPIGLTLADVLEKHPQLTALGITASLPHSEFDAARAQLRDSEDTVQALTTWLTDRLRPIKTPKANSYGLKHAAEWHIGRYVPNGELITAALIAGYSYKYAPPNVMFGMSIRDVRQLWTTSPHRKPSLTAL